MTPDELKGLLQISNKRLELSIDAFGSRALSDLLNPYLAQGKLVLRDISASSTDETDKKIDIRGVGDSSPFSGMAVTAVFALAEEKPTISIRAVGDANWTFDRSFAKLRGTLFRELHFRSPTLTLNSYAVSEHEPAGMLFQGTLVTDARLDLLNLLFPNARHEIAGVVRISPALTEISPDIAGAPDIVLNGPDGESFDLGLFQIGSLRYEFFADPRINYDIVDVDVLAYLSVTGAVQFQTRSKPHQIFVTTDWLGPGGNVLFRADFSEAGEVALEEIRDFACRKANLAVPFDFHVGPSVRFTDFHLMLNPSGKPLVRYVSLKVETQAEWTIIPDLITLQKIDVMFRVDDPLSSPALSGTVAGLVGIGESGTLELSVDFGDLTLGGGLREGGPPLNIREVCKHFASAGADHLPDLSVTKFDFSMQLPARDRAASFNGLLEIAGDWALSEHLHLVDLNFALEHAETTRFMASATFVIHSLSIIVGASFQEPAKGWEFVGKTAPEQKVLIGELIGELAQRFSSLPLPTPIAKLKLENLEVSFNTGQKRLYLSAEAKFPIDTIEVDGVITIDTHEGSLGGSIKVEVPLDGGGSFHPEFRLHFTKGATSSVFVATYSHFSGDRVPPVKSVIKAFAPATAEYIPSSLTIDFKDVFFAYQKSDHDPAEVLFGVDVGSALNMSQLPLVGSLLAGKTFAVDNIRLVVASAKTAAADLPTINALLSEAQISELPAAVPAKGFYFTAVLHIAGVEKPLEVKPAENMRESGSSSDVAQSAETASGNALWVDVQKKIGPLDLQRVGVGYGDGSIYALLDATLAVGPLAVSLDGLGIGYHLATKKLHPTLSGLGIEFNRPPAEIGGAFLHLKDDQQNDVYAGKITIRAENFSFGGLGSYSDHNGHPSLFLYAFLDTPLGGPSFFFVEGLAFGFGLNRRLTLPAVDGVKTFPLVAEVIGGTATKSALTDGKLGPEAIAALTGELQSLERFVSPQDGEYFLALGIKFNSFKQVDSFAMLALSFGQRFEFDLVGLSTLEVPSKIAGRTAEPVAHVELALVARFAPQEGFLGIQAQLTPQSYVLSQACHLQGGFAFFSWFGNHMHAGDFVITLGGYAPAEGTAYRKGYKKPDHYPDVPRVGFNWQVSDSTHIKALGYFALTPSAVMAGGALDATWESGRFKAWFSINADFLIEWQPFYYQASASVDIGVDVTVEFFGTRHITADVGADVELWGPEFSGRAHIRLWIVSFTVSFERGGKRPSPIGWDDFKKGFLPADKSICQVSAAHGLVRTVKDATGSECWIVNAKDMCLAIDSAVPSSQPAVVDKTTTREEIGKYLALTIKPMGEALSNQYTIAVTRASRDVIGEFQFVPIWKKVPKALWAPTVEGGDGSEVTLALTGYTMHPAKRAEPGASNWIKDSALRYESRARPLPPDPRKSLLQIKPGEKAELKKPTAELTKSLGFDWDQDVKASALDPLADAFIASYATATLSAM